MESESRPTSSTPTVAPAPIRPSGSASTLDPVRSPTKSTSVATHPSEADLLKKKKKVKTLKEKALKERRASKKGSANPPKPPTVPDPGTVVERRSLSTRRTPPPLSEPPIELLDSPPRDVLGSPIDIEGVHRHQDSELVSSDAHLPPCSSPSRSPSPIDTGRRPRSPYRERPILQSGQSGRSRSPRRRSSPRHRSRSRRRDRSRSPRPPYPRDRSPRDYPPRQLSWDERQLRYLYGAYPPPAAMPWLTPAGFSDWDRYSRRSRSPQRSRQHRSRSPFRPREPPSATVSRPPDTAYEPDRRGDADRPLASPTAQPSTLPSTDRVLVEPHQDPSAFNPSSSTSSEASDSDHEGNKVNSVFSPSCDTARNNLKLHLRTIRESVASGFTDDVKDTSCFQNKLDELQTLESKGDSLRKQFELMALKLETETGEYADTEASQEELLREWNKLHIALRERYNPWAGEDWAGCTYVEACTGCAYQAMVNALWMESLKAAWAFVLPMENEWALLCSLEKQLCERSVQRGLLTDGDLASKQLKEMQASVADCIARCNRLEQGSPVGGILDPVDRQAFCVMVVKYKERFEELGDKAEAVGRTLQELEIFLASLRDLRQSADSPEDAFLTDALAPHEEVPKEDALWDEAKTLDEQLMRVNICLEDADGGKATCSGMLGAALHTKGNHAVGSGGKRRVVQDSEAQAEFALRTSELFKNIQDIHDKIGKIGLRDPTIPAIQQRLKSLNGLKQKLNHHALEMKSLKEMSNQLLQSKEADEVTQRWTIMEALWNETKLSIAERQEQCAQAIELLKQYHSCKNCLASVTQEQERILSQQASYMGKENLQRTMAKVEMAKKEFNSHSEDIDRINQISKNLQFQLNKMKSFEEPPFENEANVIVDRWLDINERTENYCDNLGRALALWDKLLNLSGSIDLWTNSELKNVEDRHLTEEELAELEAGLQYQEKNLEEFDRKVDEIQDLLSGSEPLLELQVIKSSLSNKMELIRKHLPNKSVPAEFNGNTAELKGDLDLAKTQIGMTESLLKALSPSNTLEIFTKLEELHQKILQQKHHVTLLQEKTGCLNPDVIELNKQLNSVTDLFNSKKQIFQDHFSTLLNYLCKDFNDWFSGTWMSLKECFEPLETKALLEEKLEQLRSFLAFEGKGNDIHEVKTLLSKVKNYLTKATINQLSIWVRDQEAEVQRLTTKCQAREKELQAILQQFARLEEDFSDLDEWLSLQEEKWQEGPKDNPELENVYQILLKQRESFDSLAWLANSLGQSVFPGDEVVLESTELADRYNTLLSHVRKNLGVSQALSVEEKNFEELVQSTLSWVQRVKDSISELMYGEAKMPLEEKVRQIKGIVLLRDEGCAKLQNVAALGEHLKTDDRSKALAVQQTVSGVRSQWEHAMDRATDYLRHHEQLQCQMEQDSQREEDVRAAPWEPGEQAHELSLDRQTASPEIQTRSAELLQKAEGLSRLLNELESQRRSLGNGVEGSFAEESLMELKHLHNSLLSQLQNMAKLLEGHDEKHQRCEELAMRLRATLKEVLEPSDRVQKQVQQEPLGQMECTLRQVIALAESVKQKPSLLREKFIKVGTDTPQCNPKKRFKSKHEWTDQEAWNIHSDTLKQNNGFPDKTQTQEMIDKMRETDALVVSDIPIATKDSSLEEGLVEWQERWPKEQAHGVKNQMERETTQHFQTWLISEEQLPGSISTDSMEGLSLLPEEPMAEGVSQKALAPSEDQAIAEYTEMEQKVNDMKIQVAELDLVLVNDQLGEIERLCTQLEQQKAAAWLLSQEECLTATQISETDLLDPHSLVSGWDQLLKDLMTIREAKRHQFHLVNDYQERLAAVRSSMRRLSAEKDHIKTRGPVEGAVLLESIQKCLASVKKERDLLNGLKAQQGHLSRYLKDTDKELSQSQIEQAEQWWDQTECSLQRKQLRVAAEASEFKLLMSKAQALQGSLEQQYPLRPGLNAPSGEGNAHPVSLAVELQTLKHGAIVFKRDAEMRMKRIWSDTEKGALENTMNHLQNQVEELEQLTPQEEVQIAGSCPWTHELKKRIEEAILWVRVKALHLDEKAALFPDDMVSQIKDCQALIGEAKDKEPALTQLADETQDVADHLETGDTSGLGSLSSQLQTGYRDLVLKLAQRSHLLESQLGKRQKLFADVERVESQLAAVERTSASDTCEASAVSDLGQCQAALEGIPNAIQEVEGLIDEHLKDFPQGLNIFEQLFLDDCLRSLRSRTKIAYRLIQSRCHTVQRKIDAWRKLSEEITTLQQDLSGPQADELDWKCGELLSTEEEAKGNLNGLKERALDIQSSLSHLHRYKEVWECLGLKWDVSRGHLDKLQSQLCKTVKGFSAECDGYQTPLSEVEAVVSGLQKDCEALRDGSGSASEATLISAKIMSQRLQQARCLTQEELSLLDKSETLDASLKEAKRQQVKNLGDKIDGLKLAIWSQILALDAKCIPRRDLVQSTLNHNWQIWRQVKAELQQPPKVSLETYMILGEKIHCRALEDVMEAEFRVAKELVKKERGVAEEKSPNDPQTKLDELQNLRVQLKEGIATRIVSMARYRRFL
ncbi:UNVERIFIED_CONTAM: hypothetical protein K2H54_018436 [Gekko kuhli]